MEQHYLPRDPFEVFVGGDDAPLVVGGPYAVRTSMPEGAGYDRFHVTAMCSPTRAALLTGRNNRSMGVVPRVLGQAPGLLRSAPQDAAVVTCICAT
jgi:arylsulfatase A-like enzyme